MVTRFPPSPLGLGGLVLALGLAAAGPAAAEVRVRMAANAAEVSIANNFQVNVVVEGASGAVEPPTLAGEGFQVVSQSQGSSFESVINLNGRRQRQQSITYTFLLHPTRAGTLKIPPAAVSVGGKSYSSEKGVEVEVHPIQPQDHLVLELTGPRKPLYVGQEITLTLRILARRLPGRYQELDPFPTEGSPWPRLKIPWFEGQEGFGSEEFQKFAQKLLAQQGFPINRYGRREFFDEVPLLFGFARSEGKRVASDGREYTYFVYTLEKRFRAEKTGKFLFGAVLAQGHVFVDQGGEPRPLSILAQSDPLEVMVSVPPAENRPRTFTGAVGKWQVSAAVKPAEVWVGEPLTLTLTARGDGNLEEIGPPVLSAMEGFDKLFRIHDEPTTGVADPDKRTKTFTYGIRPRSAEVKAVPPIGFSYFDPQEEKYVTVETAAVPIKVQEGKSTGKEFFDVARKGSEKNEVQVLEGKLYSIYEEPDALVAAGPPSVFGSVEAAVLALPPLVALLLWGAVQRRNRYQADPALLRSKRAHKKAAGILREASSALAGRRDREVHGALARAVATLIGDRLGIPSAGMTAGDAEAALREAGVEEELVRQAVDLFERADRARYGVEPAGQGGLEERLRETRTLLLKLQGGLAAAPGRRA
jgi:hypothetical protein